MQEASVILMEEHDHERCVHISQKNKSKPLAESLGTKQFCKSSRTILEGPLDERGGKCVKVEINASLSKTRFVFR